MIVDYLIIGQGIAGSFLSYYLKKNNKTVIVIDNHDPNSPSRVAAGIINPVTGRRMVKVWLADEIIPFALKAYNEIGSDLEINAISTRSIIDFFPNPFMRESFLKRMEENDQYVHTYPEQNQFNPYFNYEFGCGEIRPAYTAHLELVLPAWRKALEQQNELIAEDFDISSLIYEQENIHYKDVQASAIIFCDGVAAADNALFKALPFAPNKGEALLVEIPGMPSNHVFKKAMTLVPMAEKDLFWIGSIYQWEFSDPNPSAEFRLQAEQLLRSWIKLPFQVREHVASIRPATLERRPFVGMHPHIKNVGILNGLGTKGCSLAPYFAKQLANHLVNNIEIRPDAEIKRFSRVLEKKS